MANMHTENMVSYSPISFSFYPLIAFTLFMAYMHSMSEMSKWRMDKEKNERGVSILSPEGYDRVINRGSLKPGHHIKVRGGEEVPADIIITGVYTAGTEHQGSPVLTARNPNRPKKRIQWAMNEVNVTGETAPISKRVFSINNEVVHSVEILKMDVTEALVNSSIRVTEECIAFANSVLTPDHRDLYITGIVAWVGVETKALNSPIAPDIRKSSPFSGYSNKGFLLSIVAMILLATINAIVAYYYYDGEVPVSFQMVWVNHCVYLNMIVPQAMEQ